MMENIIREDYKNFKELEKDIFKLVCQIGVEITRGVLEKKDLELMESRDKKKYRSEGLRKTTVKTVYGEVDYRRRLYSTTDTDGKTAYVYLLDEAVWMERIGLLSANLAGIIAESATEQPYRKAAGDVCRSTGETISAGGVWNLLQAIGERIGDEEEYDVARMKAGQGGGDKAVPVLFEEEDGVWLAAQGPQHEKRKSLEVKVSTIYEGWDKEKEAEGRSVLVGRRVLAGVMKAGDFHDRHEAGIEKIYNPVEIGQRVLNGDGGAWINDPYDPDTVKQLDRYHIQQEILRDISDKAARSEIRERLEQKDVDGMIDYVLAYADNVDNDDPRDKRAEKARQLYSYLDSNRDALLPWQDLVDELPEAPDGILYKNMGVQENQNCTLVTLRMKHRWMRWSEKGADNMAKALYRKENGELHQTVERYSGHLSFSSVVKEVGEILSAASAPKKDGKGNPYAGLFQGHFMLADAAQTAARKVLRNLYVDGLEAF